MDTLKVVLHSPVSMGRDNVHRKLRVWGASFISETSYNESLDNQLTTVSECGKLRGSTSLLLVLLMLMVLLTTKHIEESLELTSGNVKLQADHECQEQR